MIGVFVLFNICVVGVLMDSVCVGVVLFGVVGVVCCVSSWWILCNFLRMVLFCCWVMGVLV